MGETWTPTLPAGWELVGDVERVNEVIACEGWGESPAPHVTNNKHFFTIRKYVWGGGGMPNVFGTVDESGRFGTPSVIVESFQAEPILKLGDDTGYELVGTLHSVKVPKFIHGVRYTVKLFAPEHSPNTFPYRGDGKWYRVADSKGQPPYPQADIFDTLERLGAETKKPRRSGRGGK